METPRVAMAPAGGRGPSTPSRPAAPTLPPDLLREGVRRLRWVGLLTFGINVFFLVLGQLAAPHLPEMVRPVSVASDVAGLLLSALVVMLASNPRLEPRMVLDLALVYQVLNGFLIALSDPRIPLTKENALGGGAGGGGGPLGPPPPPPCSEQAREGVRRDARDGRDGPSRQDVLRRPGRAAP